MSIESKAGAVKNFAFGVGILAALGVVVYLVSKMGDTKKKVEDGANYLFGKSDTATLGTDIFNYLNPNADEIPMFVTADQELKTCLAIYNSKGAVQSDRCKLALQKAGIL